MNKEKLLWGIFFVAGFLYGIGMAMTRLTNDSYWGWLTYFNFVVMMSSLLILMFKNSIDKNTNIEKVTELLIKEELEET